MASVLNSIHQTVAKCEQSAKSAREAFEAIKEMGMIKAMNFLKWGAFIAVLSSTLTFLALSLLRQRLGF